MARQFRVNTIVLSGKEISVDLADSNSYLSHDGSFKNPNIGQATSGNLEATGTALQNQIVDIVYTTGDQNITGVKTFLSPTNAVSIQFDTGIDTPEHSPGNMYYDTTNKTVSIDMEMDASSLQLGQEMYMVGVNKHNVTITNGQVVYSSGSQGNRPAIYPAIIDNHYKASSIIGIATHDIPINDEGFVTTYGLVRDIDTSDYAGGTVLYASAEVTGGFTGSMSLDPSHFNVKVGKVLNSHATQGIVCVNIDIPSELEALHYNYFANLQHGDALIYDGISGFWRNSGLYIPSVVGLATSGNVESTGTALQNQLPNYYLNSNPNQFASSGNLNSVSGALNTRLSQTGQFFISETGKYYLKSNPNQFATSGNLNSVSGALNTRLTQTGAYGVANYYLKSNPNQFATSGNLNSVSGALSTRLSQTGAYGVANYYLKSNPNQFITSGNVNTISGALSIRLEQTGTYGVTNYYLKSNPSQYSTSGNVENTGTSLQNQIDALDIPSVVGLTTSGELESTGTALYNIIPSVVGLTTSGELESTGTALQNQIDGLPSYNLNGLTTSGELEATGTALIALIPSVVGLTTSGELESTGTALQNQIDGLDIPSVVGLATSGDVESTGTALIAELSNYYLDSNPNQFSTSGNVESTGTSLQTQIDALNIPSVVGLTTSGELESTGTALQNQIDGIVVPSVVGLTTSGELESTGTSLQNQIDGLDIPSVVGLTTSGELESTGTSLQNQIDGLVIPSVVGLATSGDLETTGTNLQNQLSNYYLDSNPNQFATSGDVESTGTNAINYINDSLVTITGAGTVTVITGADTVYISGEEFFGFPTSGELESTGTALQNQIDGLVIPSVVGLATSGDLENTGTALQNQISTIAPNAVFTTGEQTISGLKIFTNEVASGVLIISGNLAAGGEVMVSGHGSNSRLKFSSSYVALGTNGLSEISIGGGSNYLIDSAGDIVCDWENNVLSTAFETNTLDWLNKQLINNDVATLYWANRALTGVWSAQDLIISGYNVVTTNDIPSLAGLTTSGELESTGTALQDQIDGITGNYYGIHPTSRYLFSSANTNVVDWENQKLYASDTLLSVDWSSRVLRDSIGGTSLNWASQLLYDSSSTSSLSWTARETYDSNEILTLDWENKQLLDSAENLTLNWNSKQLTGAWNAQDLIISGSNVATYSQLQTTSGDAIHTITGGTLSIAGSTLVIDADSASTKMTLGYGAGGTTYAGLWKASTPSFTNYAFLMDNQYAFFNAPTTAVYFRIANGTKMYIGANGDVGIHSSFQPSTPPTAKLDVSGRIKAESISVSGLVIASGGELATKAYFDDNLLTIQGTGNVIVTTGEGFIYVSGLSTLVNQNFFFDYPLSGLNVVESYVQEDFVLTGIVLGVNQTGFSVDSLGCNFYQRLTDGTTKVSLANEFLDTGTYHKVIGQSDLPITGMNRIVIDITGLISGFEGLSIGMMGYR